MSHSLHPVSTTTIATTTTTTTASSSTSQSQPIPVAEAVTVSPSTNSTLSVTPPPRLQEPAEATTTAFPTSVPGPGAEVVDLTEALVNEENSKLWRFREKCQTTKTKLLRDQEQELVQLHHRHIQELRTLQEDHRQGLLQLQREQEEDELGLLRGLMGKPLPSENEEAYDVDITQPGREPLHLQQPQPPQQQPRQVRDRSLPPLSDLLGGPLRQSELRLPLPDVVFRPPVPDPFGGPPRQSEVLYQPDLARIPYVAPDPVYGQPTASSALTQRGHPGRTDTEHQQPSQGNVMPTYYNTQHNQPTNIPQAFDANRGSPPQFTHSYGHPYEDQHQYHPECLACQQVPQQYQQAPTYHQYQDSSFQPPYQERRYQQAEPSGSQHQYQGTMRRSPYLSASPPPQIIDVTMRETSSSSSMPQEPQQNIGRSMGEMAISVPQPRMPQQKPRRLTASSLSLATTTAHNDPENAKEENQRFTRPPTRRQFRD
ncbi:hypothetical protein BGX23_006047 [Mortierella sp. AD031]|nr:hypothetical protein BGX23_006047 [Mortierella sp. AD031]